MKKQQTAVEMIIKYCEEKLHTDVNSHRGAYTNVINFCKQQAKAMEKKQIEEAFANGVDDEYEYHVNNQPRKNTEEYYNETYGK
jgi:hypothetical protein